jgi:uncharacterized repeat protein (TIGR04076 family)
MCGYLYHAAFPYILALQFGGSFPWAGAELQGNPDTVEVQCPDQDNVLTIRLCRMK